MWTDTCRRRRRRHHENADILLILHSLNEFRLTALLISNCCK